MWIPSHIVCRLLCCLAEGSPPKGNTVRAKIHPPTASHIQLPTKLVGDHLCLAGDVEVQNRSSVQEECNCIKCGVNAGCLRAIWSAGIEDRMIKGVTVRPV